MNASVLGSMGRGCNKILDAEFCREVEAEADVAEGVRRIIGEYDEDEEVGDRSPLPLSRASEAEVGE